MQNALARAWLALDDADKTPKHRERAIRLARFLKNRLRPMEDGSYSSCMANDCNEPDHLQSEAAHP